MGPLTVFAFGFGPGFALDLFSVDSKGDVFAQPFSFFGATGSPTLISSHTWYLSNAEVSDGQVLAFLYGSTEFDSPGSETFIGNSTPYLVDVFENFFNPYVEQALIIALEPPPSAQEFASFNSL